MNDQSIVKEVKEKTGFSNIHFYKVDIGEPSQVEKTWNEIIKKFQKVNILINNAAIARGKLLRDLPFE
jgi:short-subunit dehydrogenase